MMYEDQEVSPLSEDAVQVYRPVSSAFKSEIIGLNFLLVVFWPALVNQGIKIVIWFSEVLHVETYST